MELRWDGVPSLADALRNAQGTGRADAGATVGAGDRRLDGVPVCRAPDANSDEINAAAPDTPVFVLHLYDSALLKCGSAACRRIHKEPPNPPGGEIQHDKNGNPTGLLIAKPNAIFFIPLWQRVQKLSRSDQTNSTRLFMRELNRFGLTSVI